MHDDLFRREALDARRQRWLGRIRLPLSRLGTAMAVLAMALLLSLIALFGFGRYTRTERVEGVLVPRDGLLAVTSPAAGVLLRATVAEGQPVRRGQALLEISTELDSPALRAGIGAAVGAGLAEQRTRLLADRDALERDRGTEQANLDQRLAAAKRRIDLAQDQLALRQEQAEQARRLAAQVEPLRGDKLLSEVQWQQYRDTLAEAQARVQAAQRERLDALREQADAQAERQRLPLRLSERRNRIERELADVAQDDARNEGRRRLAVLAPRDGRVSGLALVEGQAVAPGQRLLHLLPPQAPLLAELWVPDRAIGLIAPGTAVRLRYRAFPYQRYGVHDGQVVEIARGALSPDEIRTRSGLRVEAPAWRVLVALDRQRIGAHALQAQMRVDADLVLERRRLYEFVFAPLALATPADVAGARR
ncbi:HlyD family efflux transporter periplasmic adaptor subunit [Lysobacter sp. BMK333-48F3]|uniref:HlyD family secretion protein n=1 Tax=Lysobacter sp. BMK333-48F3 TaxID=2867962 RepID=UPI001C8CC711|nr:HlyD family efflux transporter periplasmic adaptor subunit [Lysobacter sp. BMK333-48F3]